jgi:DNA-binding NarL/FixJ family response regulator
MLPFTWLEFARLQRLASRTQLVDHGWTAEEQLDEFLKRYAPDPTRFDLHDCRRWLKNLARNRTRKLHQRGDSLRRAAHRLARPAAPDPAEGVARNDQLTWVKERVSAEEWRVLRMLADSSGYEVIAHQLGMAIGTLKARVSRCRSRLRAST